MFANKHRYGGKEGAFNRFQSDMQNVFAKMRQSMHPQYPHTVYYAFKSVDRGWEGLLSAMMGQFMISAVHPIRTEILSRTNYFPGSVSISLVFVLRPKPDQLPLMTVETFGQRIDEILASKFSLWWGIRYSPEDILQALIGEAAAVYSQHTIPMTIKEMFSHVKQRLQAYYNE
jgi:putative DNA methylase